MLENKETCCFLSEKSAETSDSDEEEEKKDEEKSIHEEEEESPDAARERENAAKYIVETYEPILVTVHQDSYIRFWNTEVTELGF